MFMTENDIAQTLFEADKAIQDSRWQDAMTLYDEVLHAAPNHQVAQQGRQRVEALQHRDEEVRELIQAGDEQMDANHYSQAAETYTRAINLGGQEGILKYHAVLEGKRNQARDLAAWQARLQEAQQSSKRLERAAAWEEALQLFDDLLQEMPESLLYAKMVEQVHQKRQWIKGQMKAQDLYERAVKAFKAGDFEQAMELAAAVPDGTSVSTRARDLYDRARHVFDTHIQPILQRAEEAYQDGRWADAAAELGQLRKSFPGNPSGQRLWLKVWMTHGRKELERGRHANAAHRFEEAERAFGQAHQAFGKVLETHATHPTAPVLKTEANDLHLVALDEAQAEADWKAERRKEAQAALEGSLERIRQAKDAGRDYAAVAATVAAMRQALVAELEDIAEEKRRLKDGERLLGELRLEEAASSFRKTLDALISGHERQAADGLSRAEAEQRAFQTDVERGQAASDPEAAVAALQAAYDRWPYGAGMPLLLEEALVKAGKATLNAGQDGKAAGYLKRALKINEDNKEVELLLEKVEIGPLVQNTLDDTRDSLRKLQEQPDVRPEEFDPLLEKLDQVLGRARNFSELAAQLESAQEEIHQQQECWKKYERLAEQAERRCQDRNWEAAVEKQEEAVTMLGSLPAAGPRQRLTAWREAATVLQDARQTIPEAHQQAQEAYEAAAETSDFTAALAPLAQAEEALRQAREATGNMLPPDLDSVAGQVADLRRRTDGASQVMRHYAAGNLTDALSMLRVLTATRGEDRVLSALRSRLEEEFKEFGKEASAELLRQVDVAIEDGNLTEALDLLRQVRGFQRTPEIDTRYTQTRRRKALEDRLREAEIDYQGKLGSASLPDAVKALRKAIDALLEPGSSLPHEVRAKLLELVMLGEREDRLALGTEEHWQTGLDLLEQVGRAGTEHWAARRAFYFADLWARLAREVALKGIIASARELGDIHGSYQAATTLLRQHPEDKEVIDEIQKVRELLISRLNDSASKRLGRAEKALTKGRFKVALGELKSLEDDIYGKVDRDFPDLLEQYDEVAQIQGEAERLRERAEWLKSEYARVSPLLEAANQAFLTDKLNEAAKKLREVGDVREAPDLQEEIEDMYRRITEARSEKSQRILHAALTTAETKLMMAISSEDYQSILEDLQKSQQDLDTQLLAAEDRARYTQMVQQVSQAGEAFVEGANWLELGQASLEHARYEEAVGALEKALATTREGGKRVEIQVMLDRARPKAMDQQRQREALQRGKDLFHAREYERARQELAQGGDVGDYLDAARAGALLRSAQRNWEEDVEIAQMDLEAAINLGQGNSLARSIVEDANRLLQLIQKRRKGIEAVQTELSAARLALRQERLDDAQDRINAVLERDPANSEAKALEMLVQAQIALEKRDYGEALAIVSTILETVLPDYPDAQALLKRVKAGKQANEALGRAESLARSNEFEQAHQALKQAIDLKADPARLKAVQETVAELEHRWEKRAIDPIRELRIDGEYAQALSRSHQALRMGVSPNFRVELENLQTDIVSRWTKKGVEQARDDLGQAATEETFNSVVASLDQLAALKPSPSPSQARDIEKLRRQAHEGRLKLQIQAATRLSEEEGDREGALEWLKRIDGEAEKLGLGRIAGEVAKLRFKIGEEIRDAAIAEERARRGQLMEEAHHKLATAVGRVDLERAQSLARQVLDLPSFEHDGEALDLIEEAKQAIGHYDMTDQAIKQARPLLHDRRFRDATSALGLATVSPLLREQYDQLRTLSRILVQAERAQNNENWEVALEHYREALIMEPSLEARLEDALDRCRNRLLEAVAARARATLEMTPPEPEAAHQLLDEAEEKGWLMPAHSDAFVRLRNWAASQELVVQASKSLDANEPAKALELLSQAHRLAPDDQRDHIRQWEHLAQAALGWERSDLDTVKHELEALGGAVADLTLARRLRDKLERAQREESDLLQALEDAAKALQSAPPRYDDAITATERALALAPDDSRADRTRQKVRTRLQGDIDRARQANQYDEALTLGHKLLRLTPDDKMLAQQIEALSAERQRQLEAAFRDARDALQIGRLDDARSALERARTIASPEGDPRLESLETQLKERADLLKQIDLLIREAHGQIGNEQWEQAVDSLIEARKDIPAYQPVVETTNDLLDRLGNLARTRLTEERFDEGIARCDLALRLSIRAGIVALREDISRTWDTRLTTLAQQAGSALDSWDVEEATRVLERGQNIATEYRGLPQGEELNTRLQQMRDVAPQLKEVMEKGWSALETRDYEAAREAFAQALDAALDFREAERWRDYADNMAHAIHTIQEQEDFALGARYLEAAEGLLRIGRGERLSSLLGGQSRLRDKRRLAVYKAYRLAQIAHSMAGLLEQMHRLIKTGELERWEKASEIGDRLQQDRDAFSQLWQAQVAPPDDFSAGDPQVEAQPEEGMIEIGVGPATSPASLGPAPDKLEPEPPDATKPQPKADTPPPLHPQPDGPLGLAWQVAGTEQATEAQGGTSTPTLSTTDDEPTETKVSEAASERTEPSSAPEPDSKPELVSEELPESEQSSEAPPPEPEIRTDDEPPSLSWSSMMSGYTVTTFEEEDEDE